MITGGSASALPFISTAASLDTVIFELLYKRPRENNKMNALRIELASIFFYLPLTS